MTSRRTWMLGLALGAFISFNHTSEAFAQVPRQISYQGQLLSDQQPVNGSHTITINYYAAGGGGPIYSETFNNIDVRDGIFNIMLGSASSTGFPPSMDFSEQYFIGVSVNGSPELGNRTAFVSAPYSLNTERVGGFTVSQVPTAGSILVLDNTGMVPSSALPPEPTFVAGSNMTITEDPSTNTFTFSSTGGTVSGVSSITAGPGLTGGGSTGNVTIAIGPNGVTSEMIAPGSINGTKLSSQLAGEGLAQDILGNLNVAVDNSTIKIVNDRLQIGDIGPLTPDPNIVQMRVTGVAAPGEFITGINSNGTVTTATVETDNSILRTLNGNNVALRVNPSFTNTFTAQQNFNGGITATGISTTGIMNNGPLTQNGNVTIGDGSTPTNVTFNTSGGIIDFGGSTLQNVADPINGTDVVTLDFLTNSQAAITFNGDITGTPSTIQIDPASAGIGDRLITGINAGSTTIGNAVITNDLTIDGGTIDNTPIGATTPSTGTFTTLSATDLTASGVVALGDGDDNITLNAGTGIVDFSGGVLTNIGDAVAGTDAVTLNQLNATVTAQTFAGDITGTPSAIEIDPSNSGIGDRLITGINSASLTIGNAVISNDLTIDGGTIDNTPIGATVASTGNFTTLNSTDLTSTGAVTLGDGDDNITVNAGTGIVDFSGAVLTNISDAVAGTDAVTLDQLNNSLTSQTFVGDITGTPSAIQIDPASVGIGDRLITGINAGTTTIGDAAVSDALTISGGTIDNTPIGVTVASTGSFTTLMSTGDVMLGDGNDNITLNAGTGAVDFSGAVLSDISDAVGGNDAVTLNQLTATVGTLTFAGDITGTPATILIDPGSAGIGDRLISGINGGTTTIGNAAIDDALTIDGGTVDATTIGATTPAVATFTELNSTGETMLATTSGNVVIGTTVDTDNASLEVVESATSGTEGLAAYFRTTTTGGATRSLGLLVESTGDGTADLTRPASNAILGVGKYDGALVTDQQVMGVVGKAEPGTNGISAIGVVGQATDANALNNTGVLGIARDGGSLFSGANVGVIGVANATDLDVATLAGTGPTAGVIAYNNSLQGSAILAIAPTSGDAIEIASGAVVATAFPSGSTSNRFADTYAVTGGPLSTVTINNSLVTSQSTVIVTFEDNSGGTIPAYRVFTSSSGSFDVEFSDPAEDGDEIHYMIINH